MEKHSQKEGPYGFCEGGRISNRSRVFPLGNPGQSSLPGLCTPHRAQSPPNSAFALCRVLNHLPLTSFLLWKESPGFRDPTEPAWGAAQSPPSAGHGPCVGDKAVTAPHGQFMDNLWTLWAWVLPFGLCRTTHPNPLSHHSCQDTPKPEPHIWDSLVQPLGLLGTAE